MTKPKGVKGKRKDIVMGYYFGKKKMPRRYQVYNDFKIVLVLLQYWKEHSYWDTFHHFLL